MASVERHLTQTGQVQICIADGEDLYALEVSSMEAVLQLSAADFRRALDGRAGPMLNGENRQLAPIDGCTEVWASGVTYKRSQEARMEESQVADVYSRVYDNPRPELFFKSVAWRVVGNGDPIGIRADSELNVPEPELALVLNCFGELLGVTICNDVSSRSIEGANPLYLPQAKIYAGACALGPGIQPVSSYEELSGLRIDLEVTRGGDRVFRASTNTDQIHRRLEDLVEHVFRGDFHPGGVILSTGTGIVPDMDFTLLQEDEVSVSIESVGTLRNPVRCGREPFAWLADRRSSRVGIS